jgi:hypothetical protein
MLFNNSESCFFFLQNHFYLKYLIGRNLKGIFCII